MDLMKQLLNKALFYHVIRDHVFLGMIVGFSMFPFYGWAGWVFFVAATVLIDLDHYAKFLWFTRFRYWSPSSMFHFFEELYVRRHRSEFFDLEVLHTVEIFILMACCAFIWGGVWVPIFSGMIFHELVDIIHLAHSRVLTKLCHSLIEYTWRVRKMRERGLDPEVLYQEAREVTGLV